MQKTLSLPILDTSNPDFRPGFSVVIAYEDLECGKRAKRVYDYMTDHIEEGCRYNNQMWKFDVLAVPKLMEMAAKDAALADVIIIATRQMDGLPPAVNSWIELWLKEGTQALALVALFDPVSPWDGSPLRSYLADVARRGHMEFFAHGQRPEGELGARNHPGVDRGTRTISMLAGVLREEDNSRYWGINE